MSGLTLLAKERSKRGRLFLLFHSMAFVFCFFSQRKWKCWTGNHLPWQMKELTTLPLATLKWMLQVTRIKSMVFTYDTRLCQPMRTVLFMSSTVDVPVLGRLPALLGSGAGICWALWHYRLCMTLTLVKKGIKFFLNFLTLSDSWWQSLKQYVKYLPDILSFLENICF